MNNTLPPNAIIFLRDGRRAKVLRLLGTGGQGEVYAVKIEGKTMALKIYKRYPGEAFEENIARNIASGSPSPLFLWPQALTKKSGRNFGYVMPLKPDGYEEFTLFRLAKVRFSSMRAIINAAIETCEAFRLLHAHGLSFQDINDGGIFIHPDTGNIRICDCDNVSPHGEYSGILGKARFIAPEVVAGNNMPDSYSDRFSMAVLCFMYFCIDHPFEGLNVVRHPCMTEDIERRLFSSDIRFVFDPEDNTNRPVRGIHHNAITMWQIMPEELRNIFIEEFGRNRLKAPQERMTERQWTDILTDLRDRLTTCPYCGDEAFAGTPNGCINPNCRKEIPVQAWLTSDTRHIPLNTGTTLWFDRETTISARVIAKHTAPDRPVIQNLTDTHWQVITASGKSVTIPPHGLVPVKKGLTLNIMTNNNPTVFKIS